MKYFWIIGAIALVVALGGLFIAAQNPMFWVSVASTLFGAVWPYVVNLGNARSEAFVKVRDFKKKWGGR